jgi:hypothetical protein
MKKQLLIIILILTGIKSYAMDALPDKNLDEVTGKAGITCFFSNDVGNIGMTVSFGKVTWGDDEDGNKGFIHIFGSNSVNDNNDIATSGIAFEISSSIMSIDVYTKDGITKLRVDLPHLTSIPALSDYYVLNLSGVANENGNNLGVIYTGDTEVTIPGMPDVLEVWAH